MRLRGMIAAGLCALSLATARPSDAASPVRPPAPDKTSDARLNGTSRIDLTLKHELFLKPVTETLKAADEVRLERYLWTAVPRGKVVIFPDDRLRPVSAIEMSDVEYARWQRARSKGLQYLDTVATKAYRQFLPQALRSACDLSWRIGSADQIPKALDRASPFIPYLESIGLRYGLDRDTWLIAIQESLFTPSVVSSAACEGPFQLNRDNARNAGLILPKGRGNNRTNVNESLHPILAAEAAFGLLRSYVYHTGGFFTGMSAYHTGPGNLAQMRSKQIANADWKAPSRVTALDDWQAQQLTALEYLVMPDADENTPGTEAADAFSWIVTEGWQMPTNRTTFKKESARYVPRFMGLRNAIDRDVLYATVREVAGEKLVRTDGGRCAPRGPYTGDARTCVELMPEFRERELYKYPTFQAERFVVHYASGHRPLTGLDFERLIGDADGFRDRNPHIPTGARIPEGTNVFVPIGVAERVFADTRFERTPVTTYDRGTISPIPPSPTLLPEDYDYARIALSRSEGRYEAGDAPTICALSDRMSAINDGTWFRSLQAQSAKGDCSLAQHNSLQTLVRLAQGGR